MNKKTNKISFNLVIELTILLYKDCIYVQSKIKDFNMQIRCLDARFVALGYFCRKVDKLETDVFVIVIFLRKYINYHSVNISIEKL